MGISSIGIGHMNKGYFLHLAEIHVNTAAGCPPVTQYLQTLTWMTVEEMTVVSRASHTH